jgi:hypothetical protein
MTTTTRTKSMTAATRTNKRIGRRPGSAGTITMYYATSAAHAESIRAEGFRAQRRSNRLYVATPEKARVYASAWGVGCHAMGMEERPEGVVLAVKIPEDTGASITQIGEVRLSLSAVPPGSVEVVERIDLSVISEVERAVHLFQLLGVVDWHGDRYPKGSRHRRLAGKM